MPIVIFIISTAASAQVDTAAAILNFTGYVEIYYSYDFNQPPDHQRPSFFYSHNRHNECNLNLGFIRAAYKTIRVRSNVALATGTYMNANYNSEPGVLKNVYEANIGLKLSKGKNLWLDFGIFASHIGFESAVSKDCWGITRSILADNSPYYESGIKLTYVTHNHNWLFSGLILNGWQHIQRPDGNNTPAFGTQLLFSPDPKLVLNYSTYIGNDKPDETKQMRYFHNLYGIFYLSSKWHITLGVDYGMEQKFRKSTEYNHWQGLAMAIKMLFDDEFSFTVRGEYYHDKNGVIIKTGTENGFNVAGFSLNFDYKIRDNAILRAEGRSIISKDSIFIKNGHTINTNNLITTSFALSF